jgi:hypothetical protein
VRGSVVATVVNTTQCFYAVSVFYDSSSATVYAACCKSPRIDGARSGVISVHENVVSTIATSLQCPSPTSVYYDASSATLYATCRKCIDRSKKQ